MGCDLPISCAHDNYDAQCDYCNSTALGSPSKENVFPSECYNSDDENN